MSHITARGWMPRFAALLTSLLLLVSFVLVGVSHAQGPFGNDVVRNIEPVANGDAFWTPWDAIPSPDGSTFYFTASGPTGSGVFSVPAAGGDAKAIAVGDPFVAPLGIGLSTDGAHIYVADPWSAGASGNAIFVLPVAGGTPMVVAGTQGASPHGLAIVNQDGADQIYFTGINPQTSHPAILKISAAGDESATVILEGGALIDPSGLVVTKDGTIYVIDRLASGNGLGTVFEIKGTTITPLVEKVRTGAQYAGVALTLNEGVLLVSSLDPAQSTAQVILVNLATHETGIVNKVISANHAAGGVHRALNVDRFAWADSTIGIRKPPLAHGVYSVDVR